MEDKFWTYEDGISEAAHWAIAKDAVSEICKTTRYIPEPFVWELKASIADTVVSRLKSPFMSSPGATMLMKNDKEANALIKVMNDIKTDRTDGANESMEQFIRFNRLFQASHNGCAYEIGTISVILHQSLEDMIWIADFSFTKTFKKATIPPQLVLAVEIFEDVIRTVTDAVIKVGADCE